MNFKNKDPQEFLNAYKKDKKILKFPPDARVSVLENMSFTNRTFSEVRRSWNEYIALDENSYVIYCTSKACSSLRKEASRYLFNIIYTQHNQGSLCIETIERSGGHHQYTLNIPEDNFFLKTICRKEEVIVQFETYINKYCPDFYFESLHRYYSKNFSGFKILSKRDNKDYILLKRENYY